MEAGAGSLSDGCDLPPPVGDAFQMDATVGDIYLVSRLDRSVVLGRPNIYLAVDTATQLIAGLYVGMDSDETAVMKCLECAPQSTAGPPSSHLREDAQS